MSTIPMSKKSIAFSVSLIITIATGLVLFFGGFAKNEDQNWQIRQGVSGNVTVVDRPGYYLRLFATIYTWPRTMQAEYVLDENNPANDQSIRVTFNDGGTAQISSIIRFELPVSEEQRRVLHREFSGNPVNLKNAVRGHLINCLKATAPLMSSSENQSARKAEFTQLVEDQLIEGLYETRVVEKASQDQFDETGKPITVFATEIIRDSNGKPIIGQDSPLKQYGILVKQFSITGTDYDAQTLSQFATKKEAFLQAEQSKAERKGEVEKRLMIEERGRREKAEIEAQALKEKAKAVIEAQKKVEVAMQEKREAETRASQRFEVAKIEKEEAETRANAKLEVAKIEAMAAAQQAEAIRLLALAEEERIKRAGAITEHDKILSEIARDRDIQVAQHLAQINVPSIVISGSGENADGNSGGMSSLINLMLLRFAGLISEDDMRKMQKINQPTIMDKNAQNSSMQNEEYESEQSNSRASMTPNQNYGNDIVSKESIRSSIISNK